MSLNVRVITPDKVVWDAKTEELILPSSTGKVGILMNHAPLLTALDIGVMKLKSDDGNWTSIVLIEGFAEVEENTATILCNAAEDGSSIDFNVAQEDFSKASSVVVEAKTTKEIIEAKMKFRRAKARLDAVT